MSTRKRLPYPGREKLEELLAEGLSVSRIAHLHGVSAQSGHRWMVKAGLKDELPSDTPDAERFKTLVKPERTAEEIAAELFEGQTYEENPTSDLNIAGPTDQAESAIETLPAVIDEDQTAYDKLSVNAKKAAMLMASVDLDDQALTATQIADLCSVTPQTVNAWKRDAGFMAAVMELFDPISKPSAYLLVVKDLVQRIKSGRASSDDRRLLAEYAGVIKGEASIVNVAVALDTDLGRRFK